MNWKDSQLQHCPNNCCRPPCEVVNWKRYFSAACAICLRRPPCEVVNWKFSLKSTYISKYRRPPCEVVNWKNSLHYQPSLITVDLLVRSWIERPRVYAMCTLKHVDLLVRSWIERLRTIRQTFWKSVDLLVRSWIESQQLPVSHVVDRRPPCEVVNWKLSFSEQLPHSHSRPPCEVVNWKEIRTEPEWGTSESTSLWGRELKDQNKIWYCYSVR